MPCIWAITRPASFSAVVDDPKLDRLASSTSGCNRSKLAGPG